MYLLEKVISAVEANGTAPPVSADSVYSDEWVDIGGQLMGQKRLVDTEVAVENGDIDSVEGLVERLNAVNEAYADDEWAWVCKAYEEVFGVNPVEATTADLVKAADMYLRVKTKFFNLVIADAQKEFDAMSRSGFGQDGTAEDAEEDFRQVRGTYDDNKFVREMKDSVEALNQRIARLKDKLAAL
jgi:hypothetical protein